MSGLDPITDEVIDYRKLYQPMTKQNFYDRVLTFCIWAVIFVVFLMCCSLAVLLMVTFTG